jgi:hypothetical protein
MLRLHDQDTVGEPRFLDLWAVVHAVGGVAAYYALVALTGSPGFGFLAWMAIHLVYEAKDFWVAHLGPSASLRSMNSLGNSVCDQLAAAFGYGLVAALATSPRPGLSQAVAALVFWGLSAGAARLITGGGSP